MLKRYTIKTERRGLYNITSYVRQAVTESGVQSGIAVVFCPHTTAAITINENADPDVKTDLLYALEETFPKHQHSLTSYERQSFLQRDGTAVCSEILYN